MDNDKFKSPFFTFLNPVLKAVDDGLFYGKPFMWLYIILAALNLFIPFVVLATAIRAGIFDTEGSLILGFLIMFIIICDLSWFGAQIWWNRSAKVADIADNNAEFVAIPVFSHFVQTFGEWMGMWLGIGGFFVSLTISLFMAGYSYELSTLGLSGIGLMGCIIYPIYGFITIVVARVFAEMLRALAAIANNTKKEKEQRNVTSESVEETSEKALETNEE